MLHIRRALQAPPLDLAHKLVFRSANAIRDRYLPIRDCYLSTYTPFSSDQNQPLARFLTAPAVDELLSYADQVRKSTDHYRAHRFDLLGSGWVQVQHGMSCGGVEGQRYSASVDADVPSRENPANRSESKRMRALISADYTPIDWQLDFKSGYRWGEASHHSNIAYGFAPGVDIKIPWELARMQHLAQFAWAFALASSETPGFEFAGVLQTRILRSGFRLYLCESASLGCQLVYGNGCCHPRREHAGRL